MTVHVSVLLKEVIDGLNLPDDKSSLVVDGTFGGGGHSLEVLKKYPKSKVVALDQDLGAWSRSEKKFKGLGSRIDFRNLNFRELGNLEVSPDAVMLDLGLSSDQLENSGRGFTFKKDEPLLMTMQENPGEEVLTARDIVNDWEEESLIAIFKGYGEEKFATRIARGIVAARKEAPIETTFDLVSVIEQAVPKFYTKSKIHPATKTFQALRMAVNDEVNTLKSGLSGGWQILKPGGRLAVISFHSGEDRIVKNFFKEKVTEENAILINKKPIIPSDDEIELNKKSRSAKLRIIQKK
ncbi:MAG TPA: 16S rRNA (cytosine(1402)-N(4))-methyltransferase RsmH [Candidatus Paceibacterota bacterium]